MKLVESHIFTALVHTKELLIYKILILLYSVLHVCWWIFVLLHSRYVGSKTSRWRNQERWKKLCERSICHPGCALWRHRVHLPNRLFEMQESIEKKERAEPSRQRGKGGRRSGKGRLYAFVFYQFAFQTWKLVISCLDMTDSFSLWFY